MGRQMKARDKQPTTAEVSSSRPPPSKREQAEIDAATARNRARKKPLAMLVTTKDDGSLDINPPHDNELGWIERIVDTFATDSAAVAGDHLEHLTRLSMGTHSAKPHSADAGLAFVAAVAPQNAMEAALAVQMFGAHVNAIEMMVRANRAGTVDHALAYSNIANKFSRTFATQMEALSKLRRGGEQVIRHVHVDNRGGQAIIADAVTTGGPGKKNDVDQPYEPGCTIAGSPALLGQDPFGYGVPLPGDAERPMSYSRRAVAGGAEGQPERVEARGEQRSGARGAQGTTPAAGGTEPQRRGPDLKEVTS